MSAPEGMGTGVLSSVRRVAESLLALAHNRVSLFAAEFQVEGWRLMDRLFWLAVGLALALMGLAVGVVTLALYLWERHGAGGLLTLAAALTVAGAVILYRLKVTLQKTPLPFTDTLAEFEKDRACFRDRN